MDFPGVALITGAASGIGKATALRYALEGCKRIVISDINTIDLLATQKEIERKYSDVSVASIAVDVTSYESVQNMVDEAVRKFGRIDYCANNAGILRFGDTASLPVEQFELVYQVNLRGVFFCAKAEINAMLKQEPLTSKYDKTFT
ncbi:MAG: hypothetical protein M1818_003001 [Claussenomyces sp. TS43310]|nr:MAG: hypothetical protein M1818_003001 [Claussenomyces sp. TS43310]